MADKRRIEIFSAGCPLCEKVVAQIRDEASPSCDVTVFDTRAPEVAESARKLGVGCVPAVVIDGKLVNCCASGGPDMAALRAAGLGQPID